MKILFSHYFQDDDNTPLNTVRILADELRALGHEVVLHRSYGPARQVAERIGRARSEGRSLKSRLKGAVWFAKATARNLPMFFRDLRALRTVRPDIVLAREDAYCCSMPLAAAWRKTPLVTYADVPVAYEIRLYYGKLRWVPPYLVEAIEKLVIRLSRAVVATSHPTVTKLAEYGLKTPISVAPNGVYPERFAPLDEESRARLRAEFGLTKRYVLGFQGQFAEFHGIDRLAAIMLKMAEVRDDVDWLLIGDGPRRAELEEAVRGRVGAVFAGRRPHAEMGPLLGLIDVSVVPHDFVAGIFYLQPLKIIECAAAGCAVAAGSQGDIPWLLDDGRAGLLVDTPEPRAWVDAINALLDDPARMASMRAAARRYVAEHFTWRQVAARYDAVLRAVLDAEAGHDQPGRASAISVAEPPPAVPAAAAVDKS